MGKTRVATEVAARLHSQGHRVVTAGCLALVDPLPLLPVVDVLRSLSAGDGGAEGESVLASCHPYVRTELARLVPELDGSLPADSPASGQGWQQQRLFSAIVEFTRGCARSAHLTLIIEDLHWSDPTTRDFLSYLLGHEPPRVSVLLTARMKNGSGELVEEWLRNLDTAGVIASLHLGPLTTEQVRELARGTAGPPLSEEALIDLFRRAEGNPFFTEQLLAAERSAPAAGLPEGLGHLLRTRAAHVEGPARHVLDLLAVAGRELDEAEVGVATGCDLTVVREAVRDLRSAQLARVGQAGGIIVTHALLGEAVAEVVLPGERTELSGALAEVLRARGDPALAGEVADHLARAGRTEPELAARVAAAEYAEGTYAFADAARQWDRAMILAESSRESADRVAELARRTMIALDSSGRMTDGEDCGLRGLASARAHGQRQLEAALLTRLGLIHNVVDNERGRSDYRQAVDLFEQLPPSAEQVQALHLLYRSYDTAGHHLSGMTYLQRALEVGEEPGFGKELLPALISLSWEQHNRGEVPGGLATFARARELAHRLNDPYSICWIALAETDGRLKLNLLEDAARVGQSELSRLRGMGFGEAFLTAGVIYNTIEALLELGQVDRARTVLEGATGDVQSTQIRWPVEEAWSRIALARGEFVGCDARLATISALPAQRGKEAESALTLHEADLAWWRGRAEVAVETVRLGLDLLEGTDDELLAGPLLVLGMRGCADLQPTGRRGTLEMLHACVERLSVDPFAAHPYYVAAAADGAAWRAEVARAKGNDGPEVWEESAKAWEHLGRPHRAGYARWRQSEALLRAGDRHGAEVSMRLASSQAEQHRPLERQVAGLARMARIDLIDRGGSPAAEHPATPYGLTERELDVVRLLVDGLTNGQIGARLYMSPKTASVHVTAILRKLNATNRVHAAVIAQRAGLVGRA